MIDMPLGGDAPGARQQLDIAQSPIRCSAIGAGQGRCFLSRNSMVLF
jgi:hypothetical protein